MKGSIRSKLALSLITFVIMAVSNLIPLSGLINQAYAASPTLSSKSIISSSGSFSRPRLEPAKWTVQAGILYATLPFGSYSLNLYTPDPAPAGNTPLVLFFHGCCNPNTTRDTALRLGKNPPDPHEYTFRALINNGYQVAALDYPAEYPVVNANGAEAGKAAVRFFRANAATFHIDPSRIIAWGSSGGGYPVTVMGTADQSAGLDTGQNLNYSSRVEAVLDWFGITDLQYITSDDAPFLIQQGAQDTSVPPSTSQNLYNALIAAHVFAQLQLVAHAGHDFAHAGGAPNPDYETIAQTAVAFLNAKVKNNPTPLPQ